MGRMKKYTAKSLDDALERYFKSISRTENILSESGEEIINDDGEVMRKVVFVVPPTVSSLCLFLGVDRSTWQNYLDEESYPELAPVAKKARARIECYLEEELLTRRKGIQGIIFNLQNNYGWSEKREVELGEKTRRVASDNLTMREKFDLIASVAADASAFDGDTGKGEHCGGSKPPPYVNDGKSVGDGGGDDV